MALRLCAQPGKGSDRNLPASFRRAFAQVDSPCSRTGRTKSRHEPGRKTTSCCQSLLSEAGGDRDEFNANRQDGRFTECGPRVEMARPGFGAQRSLQAQDGGDLTRVTSASPPGKRSSTEGATERGHPATAAVAASGLEIAGVALEKFSPGAELDVGSRTRSPEPGLNRAQRPGLAEPGCPAIRLRMGPHAEHPSWARKCKGTLLHR